MPWMEVLPMDERTRFVADVRAGLDSIAELCRRHAISRKTGYKWIRRYAEAGPAGLAERTSRPKSATELTEPRVVEALLKARERHPTWGAKKLLALLARRHPRWSLPAKSTAHDILRRHGLIPTPRRRRRKSHPGRPVTEFTEPNRIWTADFKGQFKTGDGVYCYPLTIQDGHSRFLLECRGLLSPTIEATKRVFKRVFKTYGLPDRIRTDNGTPFASMALARLSRLSAWWVRLGITPELIEPGKPQQNGRHERMHRTLKAHTARPPAASLRAQQRRFDAFRAEFNRERPHEALQMSVPQELTGRRSGRTRRTSNPLSTPDTTKSVRSAAMAESAGTPVGSTSATSSAATTSASRRSITEPGTSTLGRSCSGGFSKKRPHH